MSFSFHFSILKFLFHVAFTSILEHFRSSRIEVSYEGPGIPMLECELDMGRRKLVNKHWKRYFESFFPLGSIIMVVNDRFVLIISHGSATAKQNILHEKK